MLEWEDLVFAWVELRCLGIVARLKKPTLCCVHCALWKIRVWAENLDMLACTKAVRAESRCSHRDGSGKKRPEAAVEGTCGRFLEQ